VHPQPRDIGEIRVKQHLDVYQIVVHARGHVGDMMKEEALGEGVNHQLSHQDDYNDNAIKEKRQGNLKELYKGSCEFVRFSSLALYSSTSTEKS
jgi:hypothetical protein